MRMLLTSLLVSCAAALQAAESLPEKIEFDRDVRAILSDNCFNCHGPDAAQRQAELRLDVRDEAVKAGALTPGKPEASKRVERILASDPDERMPPAGSNKQLTEREKEILKRWIAEGAEYQGHWAFSAPKTPAVPQVAQGAERVVNPIDSIVLARLAKENLAPSETADRATLIRRVSLESSGPCRPSCRRFRRWRCSMK